VARCVATGRFSFLLKLLNELQKNKISHKYINSGLKEIFEELFQNKNSFLYRQLDGHGISIVYNLYKIIFSDPYFVTQFKVFNGAYHCGFYHLDEKYLTVYFTALEFALDGLESYIMKCDTHSDMGQEICIAFQLVRKYSNELANETFKKDKREESLACLQKIGLFLKHTYTAFSGYEKNAPKASLGMRNVNEAYARCFYVFIEALAISTEDCETNTVGILCDFHEIIIDDSEIAIKIRGLIWQKINVSFNSNEQGYYPAVLRVYLDVIGFENDGQTGIIENERKKLVNFLYTSIKPKILANECMKDINKTTFEKALLPQIITFNRDTGKFVYRGTQDMEQEA
jgi:hypothetical protein